MGITQINTSGMASIKETGREQMKASGSDLPIATVGGAKSGVEHLPQTSSKLG